MAPDALLNLIKNPPNLGLLPVLIPQYGAPFSPAMLMHSLPCRTAGLDMLVSNAVA